MDYKPVFIDEAMLHKSLCDADTTEEHKILTFLLFQCCDFFRNISFHYS